MSCFQVKCYHPKFTPQNHVFYVLSKGENSGKPLLNPCPNCFAVITPSEEEKELLFWLCWGLWQSKKFHYLLTGSVIPFIRLQECKAFLQQQMAIALIAKEQFNKNVQALKQLEQLEKTYKQQLQLITQAKRAIFHKATASR